ncbi:MAG: glycosyltransferase [Clostridia bacterium]|nr:glycosyltransferase [Clostridia bacterium]
MKILFVSMGEEFGGIEKMEFEIFKKFDKGFEFHFLTPNDIPFKDSEKEIVRLGGVVHSLGISRKSLSGKIKYLSRLYKFLKENKFDVVHINSSVFLFSFQVALISKITGAKKIIVHSHSVPKQSDFKRFIKTVLSPIYLKVTQEHLACSLVSRESLFTKKFIDKGKIKIIKDGIDIDKFKFNKEVRERFRRELNLDGKTVYGHVGRFDIVKNHDLLIDIFYETQKVDENSVLLLIGDGELRSSIEKKVDRLGISDNVLFLGFRENVNELLNCMDCLIIPSISEGFGIAIVEAQTNGVIVFGSDTLPDEVKITSYFPIDINDGAYNIAQKICNESHNIIDRENVYKEIASRGYDIKDMCLSIKKIYEK